MPTASRLLSCLPVALALHAAAAVAADQTALGPWNAGAEAVAGRSALVRSSMALIVAEVAEIADPALRAATQDAVLNEDTCVKFRAGLTADGKQRIVDTLTAEGLIAPAAAGRIPGGLLAGVFPGLRDDGTDCPKLPQVYAAAPGSVFGGHHSEPGGLAMHVAVNLTSSLHLADTYRRIYGALDGQGLPQIGGSSDAAFQIDQDIVLAAPIWHDWAKTMVFQWNPDGSEYAEMNFGGTGKTDAWGTPGNTKTGGHHLMGIAESMARGLPPAFIVAQASAHGAPNAGNEFSVVNWLRTGAILAGVDPVQRGYLMKDATGRLRLAAMRQLGSMDMLASLPNQSNLLYEYVLHNLSDADFTFTGPAVVQSELFLRTLAPRFGYDPADASRYNTGFRNPALAHLSAERVQILYAAAGLPGVETALQAVKAAGFIQ